MLRLSSMHAWVGSRHCASNKSLSSCNCLILVIAPTVYVKILAVKIPRNFVHHFMFMSTWIHITSSVASLLLDGQTPCHCVILPDKVYSELTLSSWTSYHYNTSRNIVRCRKVLLSALITQRAGKGSPCTTQGFLRYRGVGSNSISA